MVVSSKKRQQGAKYNARYSCRNKQRFKDANKGFISWKRYTNQQKTWEEFFRHKVESDIKQFIKKCDRYQKQGKIMKISTEFHSIPVKCEVMRQIGVNIGNLLEADGFK